VGVSLADTLASTLPAAIAPRLQLKWPNDLWLCGAKLAGILVETAHVGTRPYVVVGVGINITPPPPEALARLTAQASSATAGSPAAPAMAATPPTGLAAHAPELDAAQVWLQVAPALLGGLTSSVFEDGVVYSVKRDVDQSLCFAAIVPDYKLLTEAARAALPKQVAHKDAVYNLSRAALVPAAFCEGRHDLLGIATEDKLHQPYRMPLMPGSREVFALAKQCGAKAVYVSGAGSTVMAVAERPEAERFYAGLRAGLETLEGLDGCEAFTLLELDADNTGATVE
jgi:hypothetical protein